MDELLRDASERASRYLDGLPERRVSPAPEALAGIAALGGPLPEGPQSPTETLALLDDAGSPATVASAGGRFFGFVIGGSLPVTVAANWLAAAWDQNAGLLTASPVSAKLEEIALDWLVDVLGLPKGTGAGFVTGATMANFSALAAARHAVLAKVGWDAADGGKESHVEHAVGFIEHEHLDVTQVGELAVSQILQAPWSRDDQGRSGAEALNLGLFGNPADNESSFGHALAAKLFVLFVNLHRQFARG